MNNLINGWKSVDLSDIAEINPRFPKVYPDNIEVSFIPMRLVHEEDGTFDPPEIKKYGEVKKGFTPFVNGDVLFAKITPCMENGKIAIVSDLVNGLGFGSTEFYVLRPKNDVINKYLFYFLVNPIFRKRAQRSMTGAVGQQRVPRDYLSQVKVPLPPMNEQEKIIKKLDVILPSIKTNKSKLSQTKILVTKCKQSILSAAFTGKLTKDWREKQTEKKDSLSLLEEIKIYYLAHARNLKQREKIFAFYSKSNLEVDFQIPDTWLTCQVGHIGEVSNGSTPSRKALTYWNGNIPWVSSGEVNNNFISNTREKITQKGFKNSSVKLLPKDTILLAMIGEGKTRGRSAILKIEAATNQNIAAITINHGFIVPEYLWFWFQFQYENTRTFGAGSSQRALNCQRVRELPFVLPPFEEQIEIVKRIKQYFDVTAQVEKQIEKVDQNLSSLEEAVLAKTFKQE